METKVPTRDGYYWAQFEGTGLLDVVHYVKLNGVVFITMTGTDIVYKIADFVPSAWVGPIYPQRT